MKSLNVKLLSKDTQANSEVKLPIYRTKGLPVRFLLCLAFCSAGLAQSVQAPSQLPPDDPMLYEAFFRYVAKLDVWYSERRAQLSESKQVQELDRDAAKFLGLVPQELAAMLVSTRAANAEIQAADEALRKHANQRARLELAPLPSVVEPLQKRRQAALQSGIAKLRSDLSSASWIGLSAFINGQLRSSVAVTTLQAPGR